MRLSEAQAKLMLGKHYKPSKRAKEQRSTPKTSVGEAELSNQLRAQAIAFEREYKFHEKRKWKADFLISGTKILVEVEGGVFGNGRHNRGEGYTADCEKYSTAASDGWIVLRFTTAQVKNGKALVLIKKTIEGLKIEGEKA